MKRTIASITCSLLVMLTCHALADTPKNLSGKGGANASPSGPEVVKQVEAPGSARVGETQPSSDLPIEYPESSSAAPRAGEEINWQVISSAGVDAVSTDYGMKGTLGQFAVGWCASTNYRNHAGFWQTFGSGSSGCCLGLRGNVDGSVAEDPSLGDLTVMIDHLFISFTDLTCWEEANVDESVPEGVGSISLGDLTVLIDHLFISFADLPPCP